jgi:S-adenosylmethionine:diacylglycerol 3-amino-3-carboxypropyl transferase
MRDEDLLEKITSMSLEEAKNLGIPRRTFYRLRKASQKGKTIKLRNKTLKKVFSNITLNINYSFHILIR